MSNIVRYERQDVVKRDTPKALTRWERWKTGIAAPFRGSRDAKGCDPKNGDEMLLRLLVNGIRRPKAEIALVSIERGHVTKKELRGLASGTPTQIMEGIKILAYAAQRQADSVQPEPYRNPGLQIVVGSPDLKMLAEAMFSKIEFKRSVEMKAGAATVAGTVLFAMFYGLGADTTLVLTSLGGITAGGSHYVRKQQLKIMAEELMDLDLPSEVKKVAARFVSDGKARTMLPATISRELRQALEGALRSSEDADSAYNILLNGKMPSEEGQYHLMKVICEEGTVPQVLNLLESGSVTSQDALAIARQRIAGDFTGFKLLPEKCES